MKLRGVQSMAILVLLAAGVLFSSPVALAAPLHNSSKPAIPPGKPGDGFDISDARAKEMVVQDKHSDVATRMLHRVKDPLPSQYQYGEHFTVVDSDTDTWGGYDADVLNLQGILSDGASANFPASSICFTTRCNPLLSTWVGVGGVHGNLHLVQAGVDISHSMAFYELLPNVAVNVFATHSGDTMYAATTLDTSNGLWYVNITDQTTGTFYAHEFNFDPDRNSSEWIYEVGYGTGAVPHINPIHFSNAHWIDNFSRFETMTSETSPTYRSILKDPQGGCILPGAIGSDQESFTDSYASSC